MKKKIMNGIGIVFSILTLISNCSVLKYTTNIYSKVNCQDEYNLNINGNISELSEVTTNSIIFDKTCVKNAINRLTKKIKENLLKDCKIEIYYGSLGTLSKSSKYYISGLFCSDDNSITIRGKSDSIETNTLHEIGHYVDCSSNWISTQKRFTSIFKAEKDDLVLIDNTQPGYQKTNRQEYFAVAFAEYFYSPMTLKNNAPQTYEFIEELVANYS